VTRHELETGYEVSVQWRRRKRKRRGGDEYDEIDVAITENTNRKWTGETGHGGGV